MTTGSVLLWCFGILAALVGLCAIAAFFQKHFENEKFDERQQQIRGQANGLAVGFGFCYFLMLFAATKLGWKLPLAMSSLIVLGVLMQVMILQIYAMMHNAELPLGKKHGILILMDCVIGFSQLNTFRNGMKTLRMMESAAEQEMDMLGATIESAREELHLSLIFSVVFFTSAAMYLVRFFWPEKGE